MCHAFLMWVCVIELPLGGGLTTFSHGICHMSYKIPINRLLQVIKVAYERVMTSRQCRHGLQGLCIINRASEKYMLLFSQCPSWGHKFTAKYLTL